MSIKEAIEERGDYDSLPVSPATEPQLDDFVSATRESGLHFTIDSGVAGVMYDLKQYLQNKAEDPEDVEWGRPADPNALKLSKHNSKLSHFESSILDIYALSNGLCEMAIEWPNDLDSTDDYNRVSVLIHPVSGDMLFQGSETYLLPKSKWSVRFSGLRAIESLAAEVSQRPQKISLSPQPQ